MIQFNLAAVLQQRGITAPLPFLIRIGIPRHTAFRLIHHRLESIRFSHLSLLCEALICTPDELFSWEAKKNAPLVAGHPLLQMERNRKPIDIHKQLSRLPLNKMAEIQTYLDTLQKE
jgi:DNA-binding Xre family transcriptional regulator